MKIIYKALFLSVLLAPKAVAADFSIAVFHPPRQQEICADEKHIVIVTASYNNLLWYEGSLLSALTQNYTNFEIIITDDCSTDGTGEHIEAYVRNHELPCTVTLVRNHQRSGALQNIYRAIAWCAPTDIIAILDGDDRLADAQVLSLLNSTYGNPDVWMTHGRMRLASTGTAWHWQEDIPDTFIDNNSLRSYYTIASHLRTFYAWLFRKVALKDLLYQGHFLPVAQDVGWAIPMMELCGHHHAYIDTITYLYNDVTPFMDAKLNRGLQLSLEQMIRAKPAYRPLAKNPLTMPSAVQKTDVVIYQTSRMQDAERVIAAVQEYVQGVERIFVLAHGRNKQKQADATQYPYVHWVDVSGDLREALVSTLVNAASDAQYVLFVPGDAQIGESINLPYCVQQLEQTQAYAFYCQVPDIQLLHKHYCDIDGCTKAWQFAYTPQGWVEPGTLRMALYAKKDIVSALQQVQADSFDELDEQLIRMSDRDQIALFTMNY